MFSNLKKLEVKATNVAKFTFYQINGTPTFVIAPATEANKPFFNALLKRSKESARMLRAGKISAEMVEKNRSEDKTLYPAYIIKDWENVYDDNGDKVPFSAEAATQFIAALPNWLFDELRNFAGDPSNFVVESIDAEEAGNV